MTRIRTTICLLLLATGLLGCRSTHWTTISPEMSQAPIPLIRVTLDDGVRFNVSDTIITETDISGMRVTSQYTITTNRVDKVEVGVREVSGGKTVLLGISVLPVLLFVSIIKQGGASL